MNAASTSPASTSPADAGMLLLEVDTLTAVHLAVAIKRHLEAEQRQHRTPLKSLVQLGSVFASRARQGQAGTALAEVDERSDAATMAPQLLTYDEVAQQLSCSDRTVKRLVRSADLPTVRIGGMARVRRSDLDRYVEALSPATATAEASA